MSALKDLAYDIEQLYIEGLTEKNIAKTLGCPVELVYDWLEENGVADTPQEEDASPFATINS